MTKIQHSDTWSTLFQRQDTQGLSCGTALGRFLENWLLHGGGLEITANRVGPELALTKTLSQKGENSVNRLVAWSTPYFRDPMDYTVHGILQVRRLEWVAFPFSRGSSQPRDRTQVSHIAGKFFTS